MKQFKFLKTIHFKYQLKLYKLMTASIQQEIAHLESKKKINELTMDETHALEFYEQSIQTLVESTFLQIYAKLEEALYYECTQLLIKKNASISRFELALSELGYIIDNTHWNMLVNISKIRNCLLHGNGRLDSDRYGVDTKETINALNSDANTLLIEVIPLKDHKEGISKIKLNEPFLRYCFIEIKDFIHSQK
ncbi:hypothetical protein LEAN103870_14960 [Legionella anisa]|uniref:DUF4145 domain-containing protein n=1 Tax=Legionella anisa TaxID=28082 RepID=A0AAX0WWN0_9GAMM|nr:hypothetical protein [Legionella anisa]AWN73522.1 hypothetical protein DLD14_06515 [Legionella anisa]KTC70830.1 hypothetical protein Lani_2377 [Legionella anisa]MBN5935330.1 hypothetical protein [Legionella anisa]MCW8426401.1 hypothetical protein [Legionella anisa]MCW8448061.1 hypothetical protein [Legionella anisa]